MIDCLPARQQMTRPPPPGQGGFSLFEFGVVAALFAVLVGIGAQRLNLYQDELETVAAKQLVSTLQAALRIRVSHLTIRATRQELLDVLDENPMEWLSEKPKNYLGEYYSPDNKTLKPGCWYFDRRQRMLVFLLNNRNSFASGSLILLKFKVKLHHSASNPAQPDQSAVTESISFVQVSISRPIADDRRPLSRTPQF
jgi:type II secretory pathway pseudopilin PulG